SLILPHLVPLHHPHSPEIYPLSLHDALPIYCAVSDKPAIGQCVDQSILVNADRIVGDAAMHVESGSGRQDKRARIDEQCAIEHIDRKSTRLNSSHVKISYAVFCLKKKKNDK